jgi:hypothetical protein
LGHIASLLIQLDIAFPVLLLFKCLYLRESPESPMGVAMKRIMIFGFRKKEKQEEVQVAVTE